MYDNEPVLIPEAPGKISIKKKNGSEYIQYLTERKYDPVRKYNIPEWKIIGIRIPALPDMMLPNENYPKYFPGERKMNKEQKATAKHYEQNKKQFVMLRELFDQMYYEFQLQSRRKPDDPVNAYKTMKINSILEPLQTMMAGEAYGKYLDLVSTDNGTRNDGEDLQIPEAQSGRTYSDVALLLTQYKGAMKRYYNEKM